MKCGSCVSYWSEEQECRRHAPVVVPMRGDQTSRTAWPVVASNDLCGDYESDGAGQVGIAAAVESMRTR